MITLIIVNCQSDYVAGTMSSKSSKDILPEIKKYIKENQSEIEKIIFVIDWHPYNHCSFIKYGGDFPSHCVQYTPGACIEPKLLKYIQSLNISYEIDTKGTFSEIEETGGFGEIELVQDALGSRYYIDSYCIANADTDFVICGITNAVKDTIKNMLDGRITPKILLKGTYTQDAKLSKFIKEHDIEKI